MTKEYYEAHKEELKVKRRERYLLLKEKENSNSKLYYEKNKEQIQEKRKNYLEKYKKDNKEKIKESNKLYYEKNKEQIQEKNKERNKKRNKKERNLKLKERRKMDPSFKILSNLRTRLGTIFKNKKTKKCNNTIALVGCSVEELMTHLANQFTEGMSFENYGEWHIDHIRPCASFNLLNEEEQKSCFHYSNLQPLWAIDNIKKGKKWEELSA